MTAYCTNTKKIYSIYFLHITHLDNIPTYITLRQRIFEKSMKVNEFWVQWFDWVFDIHVALDIEYVGTL